MRVPAGMRRIAAAAHATMRKTNPRDTKAYLHRVV